MMFQNEVNFLNNLDINFKKIKYSNEKITKQIQFFHSSNLISRNN